MNRSCALITPALGRAPHGCPWRLRPAMLSSLRQVVCLISALSRQAAGSAAGGASSSGLPHAAAGLLAQGPCASGSSNNIKSCWALGRLLSSSGLRQEDLLLPKVCCTCSGAGWQCHATDSEQSHSSQDTWPQPGTLAPVSANSFVCIECAARRSLSLGGQTWASLRCSTSF